MRVTVRILVCIGICVWLAANTLRWQRALGAYEAKLTPPLELPGADKPAYLDADCYAWLVYAQRMASTGEWRIRHSDFDNAPMGRDMGWSQSIAWLEVLAGKIRSIVTGEPLVDAIPRAAVWVNPAIFAVALCLLFCLLETRVGFAPAALAVAWMLSLGDAAAAYHSHRPDHQSLHLLFSLMGWLLLLGGGAGWVTRGAVPGPGFRWLAETTPLPEREARWWFIGSGVACGLALWIGASVELLNLAPMLGAVTAAMALPWRGAGERFAPGLYRAWGRAFAVTSVVMYFVEYFPNHLSWRLETNHPLYALAGFAAAELIALFAAMRFEQEKPRWPWLAALVAAMAALPAALYFGGAAVHAMHDPEVRRMHDFIEESRSFAVSHDAVLPVALWSAYLILPLFIPAALAAVFFAGVRTSQRWVLWVAAITSLAMLVCACWQQRWSAFYVQSAVVLMALSLPVLMRWPVPRLRVSIATGAAIALLVSASWLFVQQGRRLGELAKGVGVDKQIVKIFLTKRAAVRMGARLGGSGARLMAEPTLAPALAYFGGLASVASLYWENGGGMHAATAFFDACDDAPAWRIAADRGITHVVLPLNGRASVFFHAVRTGDPGAPSPDALAVRLERGGPPPAWLSRDHSFDAAGRCVFRFWQLDFPLGVWRVRPPGGG